MIQDPDVSRPDKRIEEAEARADQANARAQLAENSALALVASELSYRRLFEAAQDGILILDVDTGRINDANPFLADLLGFSRDEMLGKTVGELSPFKDLGSNQAMLQRLQKDGYIRYHDLPLETKDGRKIAVEFVSNVYQAGGKKVIQCNIRDITERKQAERAANWLAAIVESSEDAIIGKDLNSIITNWNKGAEKIFGYTASEMVGASIMRLIPASRHDDENQILNKIMRGGSVEHFETLRQTKDGRLIAVSVTASPIKNATGTITGVSKVAHDITKRKVVEEALRASEERYRSLFNSMDEGFTVIEMLFDDQGKPNDYRFLEINPAFEQQGGLSGALGKRMRELVPNHDEYWFEAYGKVALTGEPVRFENEAKAMNRWFDVYAFRLGDAASRRVAVLFNNITERKAAERSLREAHKSLQNVLTSITDGLLVLDKNWCYSYFNEQGARMVGRSREELIGNCIWELFPRAKESKFFKEFHAAVASGQSVIFEEYYPEPLNKWFECRCFPSTEGLSVYFHDITERRRTEQALRESEEYFRFLNDLSETTRTLADPAAIMAVSARMLGQYLRASRCAYADVESDGEQFTILHDYTDGCASTVGKYQLSLFGPRAVATLNRGQTLIIRNVETELLPGEGADMFNAIGIKAIITCPLVKGGVLRAMMAVHQTAPRDWKPAEIAIVQEVVERCWATIERRTAEEKNQQLNTELEQRVLERTAQLRAANAELEAFSYSVSHDLRAPLRHIQGFVSMLQQEVGSSLPEKPLRHLTTISHATKRMGHLIDDLLAFARIGKSEMQKIEVSLDQLVQETAGEVQANTKERNIAWEIGPLPVVRADRALLRLVLVNLISNAVKFTGKLAAAKIEIGCAPSSNRETVIFIRDNGVGFDPNYVNKLFGVFQRLHRQDEFEGTGIGLANVQRIIHRHGGRVWAEGVVNGGATFYFSIPQQNGDLNGHQSNEHQKHPPG